MCADEGEVEKEADAAREKEEREETRSLQVGTPETLAAQKVMEIRRRKGLSAKVSSARKYFPRIRA